MSSVQSIDDGDDREVWERVAEHRDMLEMCVEEDVPFAEPAKRLLDRLDKEGY